MKTKPNGGGIPPAPVGNPQVNIRFPADIAKALTKDAEKTSKTIQAVALGIIAAHYGIEVAAPQRGRPKSVESE